MGAGSDGPENLSDENLSTERIQKAKTECISPASAWAHKKLYVRSKVSIYRITTWERRHRAHLRRTVGVQ